MFGWIAVRLRFRYCTKATAALVLEHVAHVLALVDELDAHARVRNESSRSA